MRAALRLSSLALVVASLPACQTQWFLQHDQSDIVTTNVVVTTDPAKAWVYFDGVRQAQAPVRIPVEYKHTEQLWARQSNYGAKMREEWSTLGVILGFPVWGIASFFHYEDEVRRHVYADNRHTVSATAKGRIDAERNVTLNGEEEIAVELVLGTE